MIAKIFIDHILFCEFPLHIHVMLNQYNNNGVCFPYQAQPGRDPRVRVAPNFEKFPIPFNHDDSGERFRLYLSNNRILPEHTFRREENFTVEVDELRWPRSFKAYVSFCRDTGM